MRNENVRTIHVNKEDKLLPKNAISTCKYSALTFLPCFLYDQFSKPANIFFLCIGLLQQIEGLSPTGRWGTIIPLIIVLSVSAFKEIYEDSKRKQSDDEVNSRKALVMGINATPWSELRVGQVVKVLRNEPLAADLVLLSSSEPEGLCYLETVNIDGESNLKLRQARQETNSINIETLNQRDTLSCAAPNAKIYSFEGSLELNSNRLSITRDQFLPRGSVLKNSDWIYGLIVYTGHETKIFKNSTSVPRKTTKMDKLSDFQTIYIVTMLIVMISICTYYNVYYDTRIASKHAYLRWKLPDESFLVAWHFFANCVTFLLLFNNLVPISLAITLEGVRVLLANFINRDQDMYDPETDRFAVAKASNLLEELGQVEYILTDKTGTLTRNEMKLKHIVIGGTEFRDCTSRSSALLSAIASSSSKVQLFMENLLTCHSVMIDKHDKQAVAISYQASSPDELGIIEAAAELKLVLTDRSASNITVDWNGNLQVFHLLAVIEFTSDRKMMSVLVKRPDGKFFIFSKGADVVISSKLENYTNDEGLQNSLPILDQFAIDGMRCLSLAHREVSEEEATEWLKCWSEATNTVIDRQGAMDAAAALIEKDLIFSGAVAIEDRLQEGVPEAISTLIKANIRVWMLTGDRAETAINTGFMSGLLTAETIVLDLLVDEKETLQNDTEFLNRAHEQYASSPLARHALLLNGPAFSRIFESTNPDTIKVFSLLASKCSTLIACRLSPIQKSQIADLITKRFKKVVLAIGDGGNDVGMIRSANVGVGITGLEGMQAAQSADFTISKFRFLVRLLLVHGSWSLHRMSRVILYAIYKNLALFICQFWFASQNMFTGQTAVPGQLLMLYNLIFTAAPPIILGLTEQFVPAAQLLKHPQLYSFGQRGKFYDTVSFLKCLAGATFTSFLVSCTFYLLIAREGMYSQGLGIGLNFQGTLLYLSMLLTVSLKLIFFTNFITKPLLTSIFASVLACFVFIIVLKPADAFIFKSAYVWGCLLIIPVIANMRDFLWKFYRRIFKPRPYHILQEMHSVEKKQAKKRRKNESLSGSKVPLFAATSSGSGEVGMLVAYGAMSKSAV